MPINPADITWDETPKASDITWDSEPAIDPSSITWDSPTPDFSGQAQGQETDKPFLSRALDMASQYLNVPNLVETAKGFAAPFTEMLPAAGTAIMDATIDPAQAARDLVDSLGRVDYGQVLTDTANVVGQPLGIDTAELIRHPLDTLAAQPHNFVRNWTEQPWTSAGNAAIVAGALRPHGAEPTPTPDLRTAPEIKPGFDPYAPAPAEVPREATPAPETVTYVKPDTIPQDHSIGKDYNGDMISWLRDKGGLDPAKWRELGLGGEAEIFSNKETDSSGLATKNGMGPDAAVEQAIQDGFLPEGSTPADFHNKAVELFQAGKFETNPEKAYQKALEEKYGPLDAVQHSPEVEKRTSLERRTRYDEAVAKGDTEGAWRVANEDTLTGLPNADLWAADLPKAEAAGKYIATGDVSGLKWVNDTYGHNAGNNLVAAIGKALKDEGLDAYRSGKGDEFSAIFDNHEIAAEKLKSLQNRISEAIIELDTPDGPVHINGVRFDYGHGPDFKTADTALYDARAAAEAAGTRNPVRGGKPYGVEETLPQWLQDWKGLPSEEVAPAFKPWDTTQPVSSAVYHGTKAPLTKITDASPMAYGDSRALFGPGLYLTDNPDVAKGYSETKGKGVAGKVFEGTLNNAKLLDLNRPLGEHEFNIFADELRRLDADEKTITSLRGQSGIDAINELKETIADQGNYTVYDAAEVFNSVHVELERLGYDGFRHEGGKFRGKDYGPHNVAVLFDTGGERGISERITPKTTSAFDQPITSEGSLAKDRAQAEINSSITSAKPNATSGIGNDSLFSGGLAPDMFDKTMKAVDFQNVAGGNTPVGARPLPRTAETLVNKMEVPRATSAATEAIVRNNMDLYDNIAAKTVDQITAEGRDKGLTMDDIKRDFNKEGVIYNDYQTRSLGEMATAVTDDMTSRWADMNKEERTAALENAIYANMSYLKVGTEQGRALRMRAAKINPEGALEAEAFRTLMRKLKKEGFGEEEIKRTLDGVDLSKPEEVLRKIQELNKPTIGDMIFEGWSNIGLLGNPVTQASNILGNIGALTLKAPARMLAGTFDAAATKLFPKAFGSERNVYASEGYKMATSLIQGVKEGGQRAVYSWVNEMTMGDASKLDVRSRTAIPGKTGQVIRSLGYKPLTFMDEFFKGVIGAGERNALAFREASKEGLTGEALKQRVMQLNEQPTLEMIKAIDKEQTHWTYQDELGKVMKSAMRLRNITPTARYIVPFVKTATNLVKMGAVELTPAGYVRVAGKLLYGKENGFFEKYGGKAQVLEDLSKATIGSVITAMIAQQAFEGNITGNGPKDKNQRAALMATGWRPQSFKIGDNYVSYSRIEPFATLMGTTADLVEAFKMYEGGETDKIAGKLTMAWGRNLLNKTMMQGLNNFNQALSDPAQYGDKWIQGFAGTLVPSFVGQVAKADDPYIREVNSALDAMQNRLPVMKDDLPMRFDIWGRPLVRQNVEDKTGNFLINLLSPITISGKSEDPVDAEMVRIQMFKGQPGRTVTVNGEKRKLTDTEYEAYAKVTGMQSYVIVSGKIRKWKHDPIDDEIRREIIEKIIDNTREQYRINHFK